MPRRGGGTPHPLACDAVLHEWASCTSAAEEKCVGRRIQFTFKNKLLLVSNHQMRRVRLLCLKLLSTTGRAGCFDCSQASTLFGGDPLCIVIGDGTRDIRNVVLLQSRRASARLHCIKTSHKVVVAGCGKLRAGGIDHVFSGVHLYGFCTLSENWSRSNF
jgi:hypothetical protein